MVTDAHTNNTPMTDNARTLTDFMETVWNRGDVDAVDRFLADAYVIHGDPGDPWEGKTLSREEFKHRLLASRAPFPDLRFQIAETIAAGDQVVIAWRMLGTQTGAMGGVPPTGRPIAVQGMTIYDFRDGLIAGHRQVVDRLGVVQQLGLAGPRPPAAGEHGPSPHS